MPNEVEQKIDSSESPATAEKKSHKDFILIADLGGTFGWFHPDHNGGSFGFSEPEEKLIDFYSRLKKIYPNSQNIHFTLNPGLEEWLSERRAEILESQTKGTTIHKLSTVSTLARRGLMNNTKGGR